MHTKGKWEARKTPGEADDYTWQIFNENNEELALLEGHGCSKEEAQANAQVIATSPRLLDACNAVAAELECLEQNGFEGNCKCAVCQCQVAIAEATMKDDLDQ